MHIGYQTAASDYWADALSLPRLLTGCRIYAYCLMTNHVHLVIDPGDDPESLSKLMKRVAGTQTQYARPRKANK